MDASDEDSLPVQWREMEQDLTVRHLENLLDDISTKCLSKCVTRPGLTLDRFERKCLVNCADRYLETYAIIQTTYLQQLENTDQPFSI